MPLIIRTFVPRISTTPQTRRSRVCRARVVQSTQRRVCLQTLARSAAVCRLATTTSSFCRWPIAHFQESRAANFVLKGKCAIRSALRRRGALCRRARCARVVSTHRLGTVAVVVFQLGHVSALRVLQVVTGCQRARPCHFNSGRRMTISQLSSSNTAL